MQQGWQVETFARIRARFGSAELRGSALDPDTLDRWSDLDLALPLDEDVAPEVLVDDLWAWEEHAADDAQTVRLVGADGRRVDASVTGPGRVRLPAGSTVNQVRFLAVLSTVKLGRGDRLIGTHLLLELARLTLVEAMLLRDRDEGTSVHRTGTQRDAGAADVRSALASSDPVRAVVAVFDRWHGELESTYAPDWSPLDALTRDPEAPVRTASA